MEDLKRKFEQIPWASFGRKTAITELARSVVPVGNFPQRLKRGEVRKVQIGEPGFEAHLMDIVGTAFQVGRGKLLTCWHVCELLEVKEGLAYIQATTEQNGTIVKTYFPVAAKCNFVDPRLNKGNPEVDVGMIICPAVSTEQIPYDVPIVQWGDSTKLGVGDPVLIGGYPLGQSMFLALATNRGVVQPTFYDGVISAIIPAIKVSETRLLQISSIAVGGISGGVVCDPSTGAVLGMVTSGLNDGKTGQSLPMTHAIPSEVLQPWADAINFKAGSGEIWR
jgi:hypothetical protein